MSDKQLRQKAAQVLCRGGVLCRTLNNRSKGGDDGQYGVFVPGLSGHKYSRLGKRPVGRKSCSATLISILLSSPAASQAFQHAVDI